MMILQGNYCLAWTGPNDPEWVIFPKANMPESQLMKTENLINQQAGGAVNVYASKILHEGIPSYWRAKMDPRSKGQLEKHSNVSTEGSNF